MEYIFIRVIRPVPVCLILVLSTALLPVRMYCPGTPLALSTAVRTASHITGASCHSSISFGFSPFNKSEGLVAAVARYSSVMSGSCSLMELLACCSAVVVFPVHFGPSIRTAPNVSSLSCNISSATLCKYFIILTFQWRKYNVFYFYRQTDRRFCGVLVGIFAVF